MFITMTAPSGAKARCRQIIFWATILTLLSTTICLAGAPDRAQQPDLGEKFNATPYLTINEQTDVGVHDFLLVFNTEKTSFPTTICLSGAPDGAQHPDLDEKFNATSFLNKNEQTDVGVHDLRLVFTTKKLFLVDNLTNPGTSSTRLSEATVGVPRLAGSNIINSSSTFERINPGGLIFLGESGENRATAPRATIEAVDAYNGSRPTNALPSVIHNVYTNGLKFPQPAARKVSRGHNLVRHLDEPSSPTTIWSSDDTETPNCTINFNFFAHNSCISAASDADVPWLNDIGNLVVNLATVQRHSAAEKVIDDAPKYVGGKLFITIASVPAPAPMPGTNASASPIAPLPDRVHPTGGPHPDSVHPIGGLLLVSVHPIGGPLPASVHPTGGPLPVLAPMLRHPRPAHARLQKPHGHSGHKPPFYRRLSEHRKPR